MKNINGAESRSGLVFCSGSVGEVSLYKQGGGLENDAGLGSAEKDKWLAEMNQQVAQLERQMATNWPFAALA